MSTDKNSKRAGAGKVHPGGRIANTADDSVVAEFASVIEAVSNLDDGAASQIFLVLNLEFGVRMAFPRLGEGCSVNQKSRCV